MDRVRFFNVLGIERSENRHSAFLQWLLNSKSSHGLGESPLKKFLALVATLASDEDKCYYYQVRQTIRPLYPWRITAAHGHREDGDEHCRAHRHRYG